MKFAYCQHFKILLNTKQLEVIELRGNGLVFCEYCTRCDCKGRTFVVS